MNFLCSLRYFAAALLVFTLCAHSASFAQTTPHAKGASGLALPRFVSLKTDRANVRRGPGRNYPIKWQYQKQHLPLKIIAEYGDWRQTQDHEGNEGWIYVPLLSGARYVLFRNAPETASLRSRPQDAARIRALVQPNVIGALKRCNPNWCKVAVKNYDGWVQRKQLWGILASEYAN